MTRRFTASWAVKTFGDKQAGQIACVTSFSATVESKAEVKASREAVWEVLTDPAALARLTPLLKRIDDQGETWVWHMSKVGALGVEVVPVFTEHMTFVDREKITFTHAPVAGTNERFGVEGRYELSDAASGARLAITLTATAELPLPRMSTPAVTRVMKQTMLMMGDRFAKNLLSELAT